jgi:hypothetical protein
MSSLMRQTHDLIEGLRQQADEGRLFTMILVPQDFSEPIVIVKDGRVLSEQVRDGDKLVEDRHVAELDPL